MKKEIAQKLGAELYSAAVTKRSIPVISHCHPGFNIEDAYEVQRFMLESYVSEGYHFSGRKVGMTSEAMRLQFNINEPDYGYLFEELKYENDSVIDVEAFLDPMVEGELAFILKDDLKGSNITQEDVLNATDYVVAALEIIDARSQHYETTIADSIADNASFGAYVLGDNILGPFEKDLSLIGLIAEKNGKQITTSSGASVMGNPANAVAWLANKMASLGEPLKRGETVLAGSFISAIPVEKGDVITMIYGSFGTVRIKF